MTSIYFFFVVRKFVQYLSGFEKRNETKKAVKIEKRNDKKRKKKSKRPRNKTKQKKCVAYPQLNFL
jgi:hypothetical protein